MRVDEFISRLDKAKAVGRNRWVACCPAHEDKHPSLTVSEGDDGRVLVHCFAGCAVGDITASVGINIAELMPDAPVAHLARRRRIPAPDVLRALAFHATVVAVAACDLGKGVALSEDEKQHLLEISGAIHEAVTYALG